MFQLIRRHRLWMLAGLMYLGIVLVLKKARLAYLPTDVAMHPARSIRRLWFSLPQLCQLFTIGLWQAPPIHSPIGLLLPGISYRASPAGLSPDGHLLPGISCRASPTGLVPILINICTCHGLSQPQMPGRNRFLESSTSLSSFLHLVSFHLLSKLLLGLLQQIFQFWYFLLQLPYMNIFDRILFAFLDAYFGLSRYSLYTFLLRWGRDLLMPSLAILICSCHCYPSDISI